MKGRKQKFDRQDVNFIFQGEMKRIYGTLKAALSNDPAPTVAKVAALEILSQEMSFKVLDAIYSEERQ